MSLLWIVLIIGTQFAFLWYATYDLPDRRILRRWVSLIITVLLALSLNLCLGTL